WSSDVCLPISAESTELLCRSLNRAQRFGKHSINCTRRDVRPGSPPRYTETRKAPAHWCSGRTSVEFARFAYQAVSRCRKGYSRSAVVRPLTKPDLLE